jgi:hypothetical protein
MTDCPNCEYHRQRAQLWRDEAYKQAGHPLFEQEPVAWISATELLVMRGNALGGAKDWRVNLGLEPEEGDVGLYTTPPQRTWVGLTDEEIEKCFLFIIEEDTQAVKFAHALEAKLKEKNDRTL